MKILMLSKFQLPLLNKFVRGRMAKLKSRRPLTTAHLNRKKTVCSVRAFLVRLRIMNACAVNINV